MKRIAMEPVEFTGIGTVTDFEKDGVESTFHIAFKPGAQPPPPKERTIRFHIVRDKGRKAFVSILDGPADGREKLLPEPVFKALCELALKCSSIEVELGEEPEAIWVSVAPNVTLGTVKKVFEQCSLQVGSRA